MFYRSRVRGFVRISAAVSAALLGVGRASADAVNDVWAGPFTGSGTVNPWSNGSSWVGGIVPTSSSATTLTFPNYDADNYTATNNLSSSFQLNNLTVGSWSTGAVSISSLNLGSGSYDQIQMAGNGPTVTDAGPGASIVGVLSSGFGYGLYLNPSSGSTTFNGSGNGNVTIASGTAGINGSGGLVFAGTGLGTYTLFGGNASAPSNFTGGVTLNSGILSIGSATALASNTLTINGGLLRGSSATITNSIVANADLRFFGGTLTSSGPVSGPGGLHLSNGVAFTSQVLTLNGAATYTGATTIDPGPLRTNSTNYATLTVGATGGLKNTSSVSVGQGGSLNVTAGATNSALPAAAPLTINSASLNIAGVTTATTETLGNLSSTGLTAISYTAATASGQPVNAVNFGALTRTDNGTLLFRGTLTGSTSTTTSIGAITFTGGLGTVPDANAPVGYKPVVPFATGNLTSATSQTPAAFVTYNGSGVGLIATTDGANVVQFAAATASGGAGGSFSTIPAGDRYVNFNTTTNSGTAYTVPAGTTTVYGLSTSATTYWNGPGALTVASGAVVLGSPLTINGPTLDFGVNTGYVHVAAGGNGLLVTTGQITGSGGLVLSGPQNTSSPSIVQFSAGDTSNPFTGGLTVNGGVNLQYTADSQLGATGGAITLNGGALVFNTGTTSTTVTHPVRLGSAGGAIYTLSGQTITVAGGLSGPGSFYLSSGAANTGTTVLTGTNTYTGGTYVYAGTLNVSADANTGSTTVPLVLAGGTLQFGSSATFTKPISIQSGSTIDTNGNDPAYAGAITSTATTATTTKTGGGTLTLTAPQGQFSGTLNVNNGTLTLAGGGTLPQIQNLNVGSGATFQLDNSAVNSADRFPDGARVTFSGGTFALTGGGSAATTETIGDLNLAGVYGVFSSTVSVDPGSATLTTAGVVAGGPIYTNVTTGPTTLVAAPQSLVKTGAGTLVLSNANTFSGGAAVTAGSLRVTNPSALGFGAVTTSYVGATTVATGGSLDLGGQTVTEPVTLSGGSLINSAAAPARLTSGVKGTTVNIDTPATNYNNTTLGLTIGTAGSGYAPTDTVTAGGGTGASANVILGLTSNSFNVSNAGNYFYANTAINVTISGGGGTGATAVVNENADGTLSGLTITNPGSGYTSAPTVSLSTPGVASGYTITPATIIGNTTGFGITGLQQTAAGTGYNTAASAVINTTTGSGASLNAPVVGSINLTDTSGVGGTGDLFIDAPITGPGGLVKIGTDAVILGGANAYTGDTQVNAGTLKLQNGGAFPANNTLNVAAGATVSILRNGSSRSVVQVGALNNGGLIDIGANDLFVRGMSAADVTGQVARGFAGGTFHGTGGITSSAAASDTTHTTAIGIAVSDGSTLDGVTPGGGDVLLKYTYFGDANLDGKVDGSDYSRIDNGYLTPGATGWTNGDFNYDGTIDASDYTLIDNAFNRQGVQLTSPAALAANPTASAGNFTAVVGGTTSAVPEPTGLIILGLGGLAALGRRRGR